MEDITVFSNAAQVFVDLPVLQVTDDTGVMPMLLVTQNIPDQQLFPIGTTPLTYTYTDGNDNFATCQFSVIVQFDSIPPVVMCPAPIQVFVAEGIPSAVVMYDDPVVTDDSGLVPSLVAMIGTASGGLFPAGDQSFVSFQYSDAAGNRAGCTLQIMVTVDTTPPLITDCSEDVSLTVPNTQTEATVDLPVPTATDNSMEMTTVLQVTGVTPNNVYPVGVTAITYIFADNYDNTNICQFTVTIVQDVCNPSPCDLNEVCSSNGLTPASPVCTSTVDVTAPVISGCPTDAISLALLADTPLPMFVLTAVPTAVDDSGVAPIVTITGLPQGNLFPEGATTVTYTFSDQAGNTATCVIQVFVDVDYCNPDPCPTDTLCSEGDPIQSEVTCAPLNCNANPCIPGLQICLEVEPPQNVLCVDLPDTTPPVITGCPTSAITQVIPSNVPLPLFVDVPVPMATDNSLQAPTVSVTGLPQNGFYPEGTTTVTYTFTDGSGNSAQCIISVVVDVDYCNPNPCPGGVLCTEGDPVQSAVTCALPDNTPPVITGCPTSAITQVIPSNVPLPLFVDVPVPMATDNSLQAPTVSVTGLPQNGFYPEGTTTVTYTFTDGSGNSAQCIISVVVDVDYCNPNPCPGGVLCTEGDPVQSAVTCARTTCDDAPCQPQQLCFDLEDSFICIGGDDTTSPVVSGCPTQTITQVIPSDTPLPTFVIVPVPTATDDSSQAPSVDVTGLPALSLYPEGTTVVTYTFTDGSGNSAQCVITVVVDRDFCNPNPCGVGVVCTEGATDPMNVICGTGCNMNSCPIDGDFCFLQGALPSCVTVGTNPPLTDCPITPYTVFTNTGVAMFDVPVPTLTDFPMLAVTTIQSPMVNTFAADGSFVTVTFTLTDDAGSTITTCTVLVTPFTDTIPPVVTACPDPVMLNAGAGSTGLVVLPTPTPDASDANGVTVDIVGLPANNFYPIGETTVTYTFSDPAGNTAQCVFVVQIVVDPCTPSPCGTNQNCRVDASNQAGFTCVDICLPTTCPGQLCFNDIGLSTGSPCVPFPTSTALGNCPSETVSAVAQFGATTATVDLPVPFLLEFPNYPTTVSQVPVGNVYNVGTVTPVTLLLFDDVLTQVAVCTRNVQVTAATDNSFQLVNCDTGTLIQQFVAPGTTTSQVFFNEPSTVGGQGDVTLATGDFRSGSDYEVGSQVSTFVFVDSIGQTLICERNIAVTVDDVNPDITGCNSPAVTTVDRNTNNATVIIAPEPMATDNSGLPVTVTTQNLPADNVYPVGINLVTYMFTDAFGNSDTCGITVTVDQDLCNPNPCPNNAACTEDGSQAGFSCAAQSCADEPCMPGEICLELEGQQIFCIAQRKKRSNDLNDELKIREARAVSLEDDSTSNGLASLQHVYLAVACLTGLLFGSAVTIWLRLKHRKQGTKATREPTSC